jgi:prepilin-type N-terminal cleavage/methylation domain-containing protein
MIKIIKKWLKIPTHMGVRSATLQRKCTACVHGVKNIGRSQSGLTLLEVAIVLIVVGVLLAGIFPKGQRMLEQARLSKTTAEVHNYFIQFSHLLEHNDRSDADPVQLSNGAWLGLLHKDERYFLTLGKSGQKEGKSYGFATFKKAMSLKKALAMPDCSIITNQGEIVPDSAQAAPDDKALYGLLIPLDTNACP